MRGEDLDRVLFYGLMLAVVIGATLIEIFGGAG